MTLRVNGVAAGSGGSVALAIPATIANSLFTLSDTGGR